MRAPGERGRSQRPVASSLPFRLDPAAGAAVTVLRARLRGTTRTLFDLVCLAGHLGRQLPYRRANTALVAGARDPRRALRRFLARHAPAVTAAQWRHASARLAPHLLAVLQRPDDDASGQPVRVLVGNASIALAPDCAVPVHPALLAAWETLVEIYRQRYGDAVHLLPPLPWLDRPSLARLRREAARGVREGRGASGLRAGLHGRLLAIDRRLIGRVSRALGRSVVAGYVARYVFYTQPGDYFFPHPDDPEHAVNVLVCLDRQPPTDARRSPSAFVAYRTGGLVERYELQPGGAIVAEARGVIHGREPLAPGERVTLLSIAVEDAPAPRRAAR